MKRVSPSARPRQISWGRVPGDLKWGRRAEEPGFVHSLQDPAAGGMEVGKSLRKL